MDETYSITGLIEELKEIRERHGELPVFVCDPFDGEDYLVKVVVSVVNGCVKGVVLV